jgi:hypothetical protein
MPPTRHTLNSKEIRTYAVLQGICWVLAFASLAVFALDVPIPMKWVAIAAMIAFLLGAVVFNWARRFGIRVLWSRRLRERM